METRSGIAALAASVALWLGAGSARADCQLVAVGQFPVHVAEHRIFIPAEINGKAARFILDTGASRSFLSTEGAARFDVPTQNVTSSEVGRQFGIGGEVALRWAWIDHLKLGAVDMGRAGLFAGGRSIGDAAGLIGYDVLGRYDLEFDLAHGMVRLLKSKGCSDDQMDYWRAPYAVAPLHRDGSEEVSPSLVEVHLNGAEVEALLDTGSPRSTVTLGGAARAGVRPGSPDVVPLGRMGGLGAASTPFWAARFKTFSIGEETIANPTLTMADLFGHTTVMATGTHVPTQLNNEPGMLLGFDFFLAHRVIISREHQKLYFSYNGGPIFEPLAAFPVAPAAAPAPSPSTP